MFSLGQMEKKKKVLLGIYTNMSFVCRFVICCHGWFHKLSDMYVVEHTKCIFYATVVGFCQRFLFKIIHLTMQQPITYDNKT